MAPTQKRASMRTKARMANKPAKSARDAASHPTSTHTPPAASSNPFAQPDWRANKKDKRTIRHNALLNKVQDAGVTKPKQKRRRPTKKLGVEMSGLGDALPDVDGGDEDEWEGLSGDEGDMEVEGAEGKAKRKRRRVEGAEGKIVMKSLKHRPGAMKRKRIMEGREMERFGRNLAQLVGSQEGAGGAGKIAEPAGVEAQAVEGGASQADRWAALRRFIGGSMEKDRAFAAG